jgi:hypothetical protein
MPSIFYWSILILVTILLAYMSPFNIAPLAFLLGGAVLGIGYLAFLSWRKRRSGVWEHGTHQFRFVGSVFVYVILFWTTNGVFTNAKQEREFWARYEPYIKDGTRQGYTFHYLDYSNAYERVDSPDLNRYLEEKKPQKVRLVLEIVRDFGKFRSYSLKSVETIHVNKAWIPGEPPWPALRERNQP